MDDKNPYKDGTQKFRIFEVLKDLKWHCSECELPGSQPAKALQMMRQDGYDMEKNGVNWEKRMLCEQCGRVTPHRRLISLKKKKESISRVSFKPKVRKNILLHYKGKDELLGYAPTGRSIEIDHRVPEVRWKESEKDLDDNPSEDEIEKRYMLLVREHNLLKSRKCEKCNRTGKRQPLLDINFFYEGDENYDESIGCIGCGWHNPKKWKEKLSKLAETEKL
jgi:hypothetical protein